MSRQKEEEQSLVEKREKVAKEMEEQEQEAGTIESKTASLEHLLKASLHSWCFLHTSRVQLVSHYLWLD